MIKIFWQKILTTAAGGAVLIAFFNILSRVLGLFRDRLLASYFGAGHILDSYYVAFRIPDLIFNTLVLGALASAFIPIFTKMIDVDLTKAYRMANVVLNYLLAMILAFSLVCFVLAPQLVVLMAPGFTPEQLQQTQVLTRIMLLSIIFFTASNVIGSILNSFKRFLSFSLAPVFYNLGIIFGIVIFYSMIGINGLAWGVVFGSLLHFLVQLPESLKIGWRWQWVWEATVEVKKILKMMVPRMVGLLAGQFNQIIITAISSTLIVGSVAIFNLSNNLQSFPISIFGVSLAIAVFPSFSETLARKDNAGFVQIFSLSFRRIIFVIVPITVLMILLRAQIVRVILGFGNFDWQDTYYTAQTLGWFSVSLFAQSLVPLLARSFYALEDTKTPVKISLLAIALNIAGSLLLSRVFGVEGLAIAFSLSAIFNMLVLLFVLRLRLGNLDDQKIINSVLLTAFNSLIMGAAVYLTMIFMAGVVDMQTAWGIILQGGVSAVLGFSCYLGLSLLTNSSEISFLKKYLIRFLKPFIGSKE